MRPNIRYHNHFLLLSARIYAAIVIFCKCSPAAISYSTFRKVQVGLRAVALLTGRRSIFAAAFTVPYYDKRLLWRLKHCKVCDLE